MSKTSKVLSVFGKVARAAGRVALPVAIGAEVYDIARAQDKVVATARAAGGLGGGFAGAKLGALAGTAILPGIGTVIGGALGGIGGYFTGRWLGGKAAEAARQPAAMPDLSKTMQPAIDAANKVSAILSSFGVYLQGQADAIISNLTQMAAQVWNIVAIKTAFAANLQNQANNVIAFMDQMSQQAWNIAAIETAFAANLQAVADNVIAAGNSLVGALSSAAARATFFSVPQGTAPIPHAYGGILTRPHLGLVAEAGPEAIIPLSARMRNRALALWEETGRLLGVKPYAEGGIVGPVPVAVPATAGVAPVMPAATINMHFDLTGLVGQIVVNNQSDIDSAIDRIAGAIADNLRGIFQNMTRK